MGNYLVLGSVSYGAGVLAYKKFYLPRLPIYDEYIESIEERCVDLSNPLRLFGGKHSYLVLTAQSGRQVRLEFTDQSIDVRMNYIELAPAEVHRKLQPRRQVTIAEGIETFVEVANKQEYSGLTHNCQHIARDTLMQLTGIEDLRLRNEFVNALAWALKPKLVDRPDPLHDHMHKSLTQKQASERVANNALFFTGVEDESASGSAAEGYSPSDVLKLIDLLYQYRVS